MVYSQVLRSCRRSSDKPLSPFHTSQTVEKVIIVGIEERDIKIKLCYAKHVLKGNNDLLWKMMHEMKENSKRSQWLRIISGYMKQVNIKNMEELNQMTREHKEREQGNGEKGEH